MAATDKGVGMGYRQNIESAAAVLVSFAVLGTAACGGPDVLPQPQDDAYATKAKFCMALGKAVCNGKLVQACYLSADEALTDDTQKCATAAAAACEANPLPYNRKGAEGCLAAQRDALADAVLSKDEVAKVALACHVAFSESGALGEDCSSDAECFGPDGLFCVDKPGAAAGTCQTPSEVEAGKSCASEDAVCAADFYCNAAVSSCIERPSVGQACDANTPCGVSGVCDAGTCKAKAVNGSDCSQGAECEGGFCVIAVGATAGKCGSQEVLASTSKSCDDYLP